MRAAPGLRLHRVTYSCSGGAHGQRQLRILLPAPDYALLLLTAPAGAVAATARRPPHQAAPGAAHCRRHIPEGFCQGCEMQARLSATLTQAQHSERDHLPEEEGQA